MMTPQDTLYEIVRRYVEDQKHVDETLRSSVLGSLRARDLEGLSTCRTKLFQMHSHSENEWRFLRQVEAFFKKNSLFVQEDTCVQAAKENFFNSEAQCKATNLRLSEMMERISSEDWRENAPSDEDHQILLILHLMRRYISSVLGDFDSFIGLLPSLIRVSPGATAQSARRNSLPQLKLKMTLYATKRARRYLGALYSYFGMRIFGKKLKPRLRVTSSNRIELVPKDWRKHRTIACEPEGNLPLQLAFDTWTKKRLVKVAGINLYDQSKNQRMAKLASVDGGFATVDFSNASDTISQYVVRLVFPPRWYDYLDSVRSPEYRGKFGEGVYEKFSSMGNGSTFCIETLIFSALCNALGSSKYSVYGDDVIIETRLFERFLKVAQFLGFTVNTEKSYSEGPFRESCGKDYWNGVDVTPVYVRQMTNRKADLCHLVNTLLGLSFPGGALAAFLEDLVLEEGLPLVPYNESTISGVWIDPRIARAKGLLVTRKVRTDGPVLPFYRAYTAKCRRVDFKGIRGLVLWFLSRYSQVSYSGPWDRTPNLRATVTSSVSVFEHRYARKWVVWFPPDAGMPDQLFFWSEKLSPRS